MKYPVFAPDGVADGAGAGAGAAAAGAGAAAAGDGKGVAAAGAGAAAGDGKGAGAADGAAAAAAAAAAAGDGKGAAAQPSWDADHWKSTYAGDDAKKKAWVDRRPDLKTALDTGFQADQKISELTAVAKKVLPENATPEQITQYRKDNGIPENPAAYFDALPKDAVAALTDVDKGVLTPYLGLMQN